MMILYFVEADVAGDLRENIRAFHILHEADAYFESRQRFGTPCEMTKIDIRGGDIESLKRSEGVVFGDDELIIPGRIAKAKGAVGAVPLADRLKRDLKDTSRQSR